MGFGAPSGTSLSFIANQVDTPHARPSLSGCRRPARAFRLAIAAGLAAALAGCGARSSLLDGEPPPPPPEEARCEPAPVTLRGYGDELQQTGSDIAVDRDGNIFVTGHFGGAIDFGGAPLTAAGKRAFFLTKLDKRANPVWSKRLGSFSCYAVFTPGSPLSHTCETSVAASAEGGVVLAATYQDPIDFGAGLQPSGAAITRYDPDGSALFSGHFAADVIALAKPVVGADGSILVGGDFVGELSYNGVPLGDSAGPSVAAFLAKLAPGGALLWAKTIVTHQNDISWSGPRVVARVFLQESGDAAVVGQFLGSGQMDFGDGGEQPDTGAYMAIYDPAGDLSSKTVLSDVWLPSSAVAMSSSGSLLIFHTGSDPGIRVGELTPGGPIHWLWGLGKPDAAGYPFIEIGPNDDVIFGGYFSGTIDFGDGPLSTSFQQDQIFAVRLNASRELVWSRGFGGPRFNLNVTELKEGVHGPHLAVGSCGTPWLFGSFAGELELGGASIEAAGDGTFEDMFLAGLSP